MNCLPLSSVSDSKSYRKKKVNNKTWTQSHKAWGPLGDTLKTRKIIDTKEANPQEEKL